VIYHYEVLEFLVKEATSYCVHVGENNKKLGGDNIFFHVMNLIANQATLSKGGGIDFARSYLIFKEIPEILSKLKPKINILDEFNDDKGYSIDCYLQACFLLMAGMNVNRDLTDEYLSKKVGNLDFNTINKVLSDISATAVHFKREQRKFNSSRPFVYNLLLHYPIIKPWSHISSKSKGKRYVAPLPDLIGLKAHMGIYYHFLTKHGKNFSDFFGKNLFEKYIEIALKEFRECEIIKNDDDIKKECTIPKKGGIKIPDYLIVDDNKGIIIECKAAVLPLSVLINGEKESFNSTFSKIQTALNQVDEFEKYAQKKQLYGVDEWLKVVITYQPLWGHEILSEFLINEYLTEDLAKDFKSLFRDTLILSAEDLDQLQIHKSGIVSFYELLKEVKKDGFENVLKKLELSTKNSFKDSYLYKYFEKIYGCFKVPER